jgi:hypothetical protein
MMMTPLVYSMTMPSYGSGRKKSCWDLAMKGMIFGQEHAAKLLMMINAYWASSYYSMLAPLLLSRTEFLPPLSLTTLSSTEQQPTMHKSEGQTVRGGGRQIERERERERERQTDRAFGDKWVSKMKARGDRQ